MTNAYREFADDKPLPKMTLKVSNERTLHNVGYGVNIKASEDSSDDDSDSDTEGKLLMMSDTQHRDYDRKLCEAIEKMTVIISGMDQRLTYIERLENQRLFRKLTAQATGRVA